MTPDRWRRIEDIFAAAIEHESDSRGGFLEEACRGDPALRKEVDSLIAALSRNSTDFLESTAMERMALSEGEPSGMLEVGSRLGAFEILAPIGAGGMGAVYRAKDLRLDRNVALKVLPESLAADPAARARFEKEAKAVAALSHPNILAIFDVGVHNEITYAVMELLEGETLRGKVEAGPVSEKPALDCALQIARGLCAAHEKGIVHRDLKPENVFVTNDGQVKILDFGLSKRFGEPKTHEEGSVPTGSEHTQPGTVMGTVGYMSPEQAKGLPVDQRSDIFSLGTILLELLTGKRAFRKETPEKTLAAILDDEPSVLAEAGQNISPATALVLRRCLTKDPEGRFQSARDVAVALAEVLGQTPSGGKPVVPSRTRRERAAIAAAVVGILGVAGMLSIRQLRRDPGKSLQPRRVAVLPFENLGAPDDDYLADGIADAVREKLAVLPVVQVIGSDTSALYKKTRKSPRQIAQELDVTCLLRGKVRWQKGSAGDRGIEISPELLEVTDSGAVEVRWKQPYDVPLAGIFEVQSSIASKAAQALGVAMAARDEDSLKRSPTLNLEAYDLLLRAEEIFRRLGTNDTVGHKDELELLEKAVALDPSFAEAWARIAVCSAELYRLGVSGQAMLERAEQAAYRATTLAPDRPEVFEARSTNEHLLHHDLKRALEIVSEGRGRWPTNALLLNQTANLEVCLGRWEDAVDHYRQASRLDPRFSWGLGGALTNLRRYPESIQAIERAMVVSPENLDLIQGKAYIFLARGDLASARAVLRQEPSEVEPVAYVAFMASDAIEWDMSWALDDAQRDLLLGATPDAFGGDRGQWSLSLAVASALRGDVSKTHSYAEQARKSFEEQLEGQPDNPNNERIHASLGLALAYLGRREEAVREGELSVTLMPLARDAWEGATVLSNLVRIYIVAGEPEKALEHLERVMKVPGLWAPGWLRIDPNFDALRRNARFQKLVAQK